MADGIRSWCRTGRACSRVGTEPRLEPWHGHSPSSEHAKLRTSSSFEGHRWQRTAQRARVRLLRLLRLSTASPLISKYRNERGPFFYVVDAHVAYRRRREKGIELCPTNMGVRTIDRSQGTLG
jgi:hypothetical protein